MSNYNRYREEEKVETNEEKVEENNVDTVESVEVNDSNDNKQSKKESKKDKKYKEQIVELEEEVKRLNDQLLRNRAELENFKRRMNEERIRERKYALQDIATDLVQIVDIFEKACGVTTDDPKMKNFLIGFQMVNGQFKNILETYGVKKIDALNKPFDPTVHQAVETEVNDELPEDTIVKVFMDGYMYKDRVLKPSMVIVSKKSENQE